MNDVNRIKGILFAVFILGSLAMGPIALADGDAPAEFDVGQTVSGTWAGLGSGTNIIVRNRTGQSATIRFTTKNSVYSGPNCIHQTGLPSDSYWQQHPNDGGLRFGSHYGTPSQPTSAPANANSYYSYEGTQTGFQYYGFSYSSNPDPKAPRFKFQGLNDRPTISFSESHALSMEKLVGGVWTPCDEKTIHWGLTFRPKLVTGGTFGNDPGKPVWVYFDVGGDYKPPNIMHLVRNIPSGDQRDEAEKGTVCGTAGKTLAKDHSVDLSFKLTGDNFGRYAAELHFYQRQINGSIYDPRLLTIVGDAQVARSFDSTTLAVTQFQTQNDVVVVDDPSTTDEQFVLKFYVRDPSWTAAPGNPLPVTGDPHTTVTIQNPDRTLATHSQLRATRVTPDKTETWDYAYTAANNQWVMVGESGTRTETVIYSATSDPAVTQEMRTVVDENNFLLSKVKTLWQNFSFGSAPIEQTVDPDGKALKTTWTYNTNTSPVASFGRVATRIDPSGAWIKYTYHATMPEVTKTVQGWLGAPITAPESQCRVQERTWNPSGPPSGTTLETEKINGVVVSRKFVVEYSDGYDEIQCLTQSAAWNDSANLVTKTRYCTDSVFKTKLKSVIRPDGTGTFYSYQVDGTTLDDSTQLTTTVTDGALNAGATAVVDGTQTSTLTNKQGGVIFRQVTDIVSGKVMDQQLATTADAFGRPTDEQFLDGTTQQTAYGCCGIDSRTDRRGITTAYADLTQSHTTTQTSLGITAKTHTSGLSVISSRVGTDSSEITLSTSEYNLAGQLISKTVAAGGSAAYSTVIDGNGNTVFTTTYADGGTMVATSYPDGNAKSVTGNSVSPVRYDYGVETDGTNWVKAIALDATGNDTQEWTKTWKDLAGRIFKVEKSGAGSTTSYFNSKGQLSKVVDPDGVTTLFTYDARGRQQRAVLDMNQNGAVEDNGTDRIGQTDITVTSRPDGRNVERTTQTVWTTDNNASATAVLSTTDRAVDGLDTWVTAGGVTTQSHVAYASGGAWTETFTAGDGSSTIRNFTSGRLTTETRKDSTGATISSMSYSYDVHGRLSQTQDGRGATIAYGYDAGDRLHTVTGPAATVGGTPPVTTIDYDNMGWRQTVTDTANGTVTYAYFPTGAVQSVSGNRAYPISYTYTDQGRMSTMTTATGITTWVYEAITGRLWKKLDAANKGPVFTYTSAGRLATKTNARGSVATYGYNNAGENTSIAYNDGITPAVTTTFNRFGQAATIASGGVTETVGLNVWGQLESESFSGGALSGLGLTHTYDALRRRTGLSSTLGSTALTSQTFGYDNASRLASVTGGNESATYGYDPNADLVTSVTLKDGGTTRLSSQRSYDLAGRLEWSKSLNAQNQSLFESTYAYNNLDQRTSVTREDGTQWAWGYNDRGEVTSGGKKFNDGTQQPVLQFGYAYDAIGNRTSSSKSGSDSGHTSSYSPNTLNQYTSRTVPPLLAVTGEAAADAAVAVQAKKPQRKGTAFWREWSVDNSAGPVRENVRVAAAKPGAGSNGADLINVETGKLYLPPAAESFTYDDDGNLIGDSRWAYAWDAENRLLSMQENSAALPTGWVRQRLEFSYDAGSRRVRKTVKQWDGSAWQTTTDTGFVYDGWNLIAEVNILQPSSPSLVRSYSWGLDLSQSLQGAGGVGGLLWAQSASGGGYVHFAAYDGNGNVLGYVDGSSGQPVLKLDYDPFGNVVMAGAMGDPASAAVARGIPFQFSTKYLDVATGLSYYGYRYYSPEFGKWLCRDPIEEKGGINLYAFCRNAAINLCDHLGNKFLWFSGSEIVEYSGRGYVSAEKIDWGTAGQKWSAVSGGTDGKPGLPDGWYKTTGLKPLADKAGSLTIGKRSEASFTENGIYFQGTMAAWDKKGYNSHPVEGYGQPQYGYNPKDPHDAAIGKPKNVEFKVGLMGAHGNKAAYSDGYRIHPKDKTTTSGCIGIQGYDLSVSFLTFIKANSGIELYVGNLCGAAP